MTPAKVVHFIQFSRSGFYSEASEGKPDIFYTLNCRNVKIYGKNVANYMVFGQSVGGRLSENSRSCMVV